MPQTDSPVNASRVLAMRKRFVVSLRTSSKTATQRLFEVRREERREFVERNQIHAIIKIHMPGAFHDKQFLRFGGSLVGVLTELLGMSLVARDEQ